jgi:hypothetical protein
MWQFLWYPDGTCDPWATWYGQQDEDVQSKHDSIIAFLLARESHEWRPPQCKKLEGYKKLFEIIISTRVEHRLLGTFLPKKQFLIVQPCTHKGQIYTPKRAFDLAMRKISEIENGEKTAVICSPPEEA